MAELPSKKMRPHRSEADHTTGIYEGLIGSSGTQATGAIAVPVVLLLSLAHSLALFISVLGLIFSVLFLFVFTAVKKPKWAVACWCTTIGLISYILFGIFDF